MTTIGSIVNGIEGLFGGSSADRGQQRDTDSQGANLGNAGNSLNTSSGYFGQDAGTLASSGAALGQQSGVLANENNQANQQNTLANTAAGTYNNDYGSAINALLGADGFTQGTAVHSGALQAGGGGSGETGGTTGGLTYNQNFDPLSTTGSSIIGQYNDSVAPQYQNAINASQHDLLSRGITGASTIGPAQDAQIRQAQASDVANFGRNLGVQDAQEQYNRLGNAVSLINGAGQTAQQGYSSAGQTYGNTASGYGSNASGYDNNANGYGTVGNDFLSQAGGYGNLSTGYQNGANQYNQQAQQQQNNLGGLAGLFATGGQFGNVFNSNPNAAANTTAATNAAAGNNPTSGTIVNALNYGAF